MRIASFSSLFGSASSPSALSAPVQALVAFFVPAQTASAYTRAAVSSALAYRTPACSYPAPKLAAAEQVAPTTPNVPVHRLKIVRAFEPSVNRSCAGRLVISGRLSDVCAELERMADQQVRSKKSHR